MDQNHYINIWAMDVTRWRLSDTWRMLVRCGSCLQDNEISLMTCISCPHLRCNHSRESRMLDIRFLGNGGCVSNILYLHIAVPCHSMYDLFDTLVALVQQCDIH